MQDCGHTCPQNSSKLRALHFNESIKALKYQSQSLFLNITIIFCMFLCLHMHLLLSCLLLFPPLSVLLDSSAASAEKDNETELREVSY